MAEGRWMDFGELTRNQQSEALNLRPKWENPEQFFRFQFWIKPDGTISKRKGHHQFTKAEAKKVMEDWETRHLHGNRPDKGDLNHIKTTTFTMNREK